MFRPALSEMKALKDFYKRIPLSMEVYADLETPIRLLRRFYAKDSHCFLFESVEGSEKHARYSFLGFEPCMTISVIDGKTTISSRDGGVRQYVGNPVEIIRRGN